MMTCRDIQEQLPFYLEDLLSSEEKDRLEAHLSICMQCRRSLADLKKTEKILKNLEEVEPPPFFEERIMARVREEAQEKKGIFQKLFFPVRIKVPIQALATVLIAVLAVYLYRQNESEIKPNLIPPPSYQEPAQSSRPTAVSPASQPPKVVVPARPGPEKDVLKRKPDTFAPAPPAPESSDSARKEKAIGSKEEKKPTGGKPGVPFGAMRDTEDFSSQLPVFSRGSERMEKQEAGSGLEVFKLERKGDGASIKKKVLSREDKTGPSAAPVPSKLEGAGDEGRTAVEVFVSAKEMDQAVREIEGRLRQTGARILEKRPLTGRAYLKTEIPASQIPVLLNNLSTVGKVITNQKPLEGGEGKVILTIQILTYAVE